MLQSLKHIWRPGRQIPDGPAALQVGAIPYVLREGVAVFLLITSRRTGRWIFPKGGCGKDENPAGCAMREAWEEAGVKGDITGPAVGVYRDRKIRPRAETVIEVQMYPLCVSEQADDWPEKDERRRHWATLKEARALLTTPGLLELAEKAEAQILANVSVGMESSLRD